MRADRRRLRRPATSALLAVLVLAALATAQSASPAAGSAASPSRSALESRAAVRRGDVVIRPSEPVRAAADHPPAVASSSDQLLVRPRQRLRQLQELQRQAAAAAADATAANNRTATGAAAAAAAAAAAGQLAREREQRLAFEREALERDRRATTARLRYVRDAHAEATREARAHEQALRRGENEFVADTPAWDYAMPVAERIRAATEAPLLELNYCCCRCGGDNVTRDDSQAVFEYAEATDMECEDDFCEEQFALCRQQFVWNGRTGTMGLRGIEQPSPRVIVRRCQDLWHRSLEMIAVLAVSN